MEKRVARVLLRWTATGKMLCITQKKRKKKKKKERKEEVRHCKCRRYFPSLLRIKIILSSAEAERG